MVRYLDGGSGGGVVQHVGTDVEHLEEVGEELLHHADERAVTERGPGLLRLGHRGVGLLLAAPRALHALGGGGYRDGTAREEEVVRQEERW